MALQLELKLKELSEYYLYYSYIINKNLFYLEKDFSKLSKNEIYIFKYISHILVDENSIENLEQLKEIKNFLDGDKVKIEELKKSIENRKKKESEQNLLNKDYISYEIDFNDNFQTIDYIIKENIKIDRKDFSQKYKKSFDYQIFNSEIVKIIENEKIKLKDFESGIFRTIISSPEYSDKFYEEIRPIINKIIKKILSSNAANKFFEEIYKKKYNNLIYHFKDENVQDEILKRISFYPLFKEKVNAFTNPCDLTISVNSIPGRFSSNRVNFFNKKILQIGRISLFLIHEIFGHFIRRYYAYLTNGEISFSTDEDNLIDTKPEGGKHVEKHFLGFYTSSYLTIRNALCFFAYKYLNDYPLAKDGMFQIDKEKLKYIIKENPEVFNFILKEEEGEEEEEEGEEEEGNNKIKEKNKGNQQEDEEEEEESDSDNGEEFQEFNLEDNSKKISLNQYYNILIPVTLNQNYPTIITCGIAKEDCILL